MARPSSFVCRSCASAPAAPVVQYCEECFGPLDVVAGPPGVTREELRSRIGGGPHSMWRYRDLLPFDEPPGAQTVGMTPLVRAERLGRALGLDDLWLKDDTANPTGSFKDRVVAAALGRALIEGRRVVACASTGNLAHAAAQAARRAGLEAVVLVPDELPTSDQRAIAASGALVVPVAGGYDGVNRLAGEVSMDELGEGWAWLNIGLRAWYVLGSSTVSYEVAEQLGWRRPDHVVVPIASGAMALAIHRAFADLAEVGLVDPAECPTAVALWGAQPAGCAPVADAFTRGAADVRPVRPETLASSLAMGDPPDGPEVLAAARASGGGVVAAPEADIAGAQRLLRATEGIEVEAAGGVVIAVLQQMAADGAVAPGATVVACLTGGPHDRWVASPGPTEDRAMVAGRVAGTIPPTVSALSAVLREGRPGPPEEPRR